jgi:hypothetical protein
MAEDTKATTIAKDDDPLRWEAENGPRAGRFGLIAGLCTLLGSVVTLLANAGAPRGDESRVLTLPDTLNNAANGKANPPGQASAIFAYQGHHWIALILGTILVGIGTAAIFPPLAYLWRATRARPLPRGTVPRFALLTTAIGAVAAAVGLTVSGVALWILAHDFVSATDQSNSVAVDARTNPVVIAGAFIGEIGLLALAVSFLLICLHAQRAGLLGRFMGVVGMFAGATIIIRQFDPPGIVRSFWLIALGLLILDRLPRAIAPRGRPPAWAVAEAVPWPSQQQLREEREAARRKERGEPDPEPARERPTRRRGRDAEIARAEESSAAKAKAKANVPAPRAPQPRREDAAAPGAQPHPSSKKRKRKRRS